MDDERRNRIANLMLPWETRTNEKDLDYFSWAQNRNNFTASPNFEDRREVEMTQPERYKAGTQSMLYDNESRMVSPQIPPMTPLAQQMGAGAISRPRKR